MEVRNIDFYSESIGYDAKGEFNYTDIEAFGNLIFQRNTGKLDNKGNPIFEGDIVEFVFAQQTNVDTGEKQGPPDSFGVYEVFYKKESACFYLRVHKKNWIDLSPIIISELPLSSSRIERVIGNILENPNFLRK